MKIILIEKLALDNGHHDLLIKANLPLSIAVKDCLKHFPPYSFSNVFHVHLHLKI